MKGKILIILLICLVLEINADSLSINRRLDSLENAIGSSLNELHKLPQEFQGRLDFYQNRIKSVESNQLNYKIEKDLLEKAYNKNYEWLNLFITFILGIIGFVGFAGWKDISKIKKDYQEELNEVTKMKAKLELQFSSYQSQFESIKEINTSQDNKIEFLNFKSKILSMIEDRFSNPNILLEHTEAALERNSDDLEVSNAKGLALVRVNQVPNALKYFRKLHSKYPNERMVVCNIIEVLIFENEIQEAKKLLRVNKALLGDKIVLEIKLLMEAIIQYHKSDLDGLKNLVNKIVNEQNQSVKLKWIGQWNLAEAMYFITHLPENEMKTYLQNVIWYFDGEITGVEVLEALGLDPLKKSK